MKLRKILLIGMKNRIFAYLLVTIFTVRMMILVSQQMELISKTHVSELYMQFSHVRYFALYYIPVFLIIVGMEDILNDYLIFSKFNNIDFWWKDKIKLLSLDTLLYVILLEIPIIILVVMHVEKLDILNAKSLVFIAVDLVTKYMIFLIVGLIFLFSSFVTKKQYIGFTAGFFAGAIDYILMILHFDRYAVIVSGMMTQLIMSFNFSAVRFLLLSAIYIVYLVSLFIFLYCASGEILKKIDLYRGDLKLER